MNPEHNMAPPATVSPRPPNVAGVADALPSRRLAGVALVAAGLVLLPLAGAYGVRLYLDGAHRVLDRRVVDASGAAGRVTALFWAPQGAALMIGTEAGTTLPVAASDPLADLGENTATPQPPIGEIAGFIDMSGQGALPLALAHDHGVEAAARGMPYRVLGVEMARRTLAAASADNGGTLVVGRPVETPQADGATPDAAGAPPFVQSKAPADPKGAPAPPDPKAPQPAIAPSPIPQLPMPARAAAYQLIEYRDILAATPTEVGPVFGVDDPRAVVAVPGTSGMIVGDGGGALFSFDASAQIGGTAPDQYMNRLLDGTGSPIIALLASAPGEAAARVRIVAAFADGGLKSFEVNRASGATFPVQTGPVADIVAPGTQWVADQRFAATPPVTATGAGVDIAAMSADGTTLVLTDAGGVAIWLQRPPAGGGMVTKTLPGGLGAPFALSADGARVAGFDASTGTLVVSHEPLNEVATVRLDAGGLNLNATDRALLSPDGSRLAVLALRDGDTRLVVYDVARGRELLRRSLPGSVDAMAFSPDGALLAEIGKAIRVQSLDNAAADATVADVTAPRPDSAGNGARLAFAPGGRSLVLLDPAAGRLFWHSIRSGTVIRAAADDRWRSGTLSGDGSRLVVNAGGALAVFDTRSGLELARFPAENPTTVTVSRDAAVIAVSGPGGLALYRAEPDPARTGPMPPLAEDGLALTADGTALLTREPSGALHIADLSRAAGGRVLLEPFLPARRAVAAAIAPDGSEVALAEADGSLVLAPRSGTSLLRAPGHGDVVTALAFSPDGAYLAAASLDGRVRLTNLARLRFVGALPFAYLPAGSAPDRLRPRLLASLPAAPAGDAALARDAVLRIQKLLNDSGYGPLTVDGLIGPMTMQAVSRFQTDRGQTPTGSIDSAKLTADLETYIGSRSAN